MPLFPRVTTSRSYLHRRPTPVLTRASVHLTTAILQEGKRQTLVASGGRIPWAHDGMWRIMSPTHQILLPLSWVEVYPLATQGLYQPVLVAKLRQGVEQHHFVLHQRLRQRRDLFHPHPLRVFDLVRFLERTDLWRQLCTPPDLEGKRSMSSSTIPRNTHLPGDYAVKAGGRRERHQSERARK